MFDHICGDLGFLYTLSCKDSISYKLKSNGKRMKGELPSFNNCAKCTEWKAIPGDLVPERDDGENQQNIAIPSLCTTTIHIISNA